LATPTPTKKLAPTAPPDQFVGFWQRLYERIAPYVTGGLVMLIGIVVLVIGGWVASNWLEARKERATDQLGHVLKIAEAELLPATPAPDKDKDKDQDSDDTDVPRFKTAKERNEAVLKAVGELDQKYGSTPAATRALLLRAGALYDDGKYAEAEAVYRQFLDKKPIEPVLIALAHEDIGLCAEARGDLDQALREFGAQQVGSFYRERSLWNQARVYAKKGDKKKAIELYKDLLSKASPQSALRDEAQNRLAALEQ
jgi:predicted negative regulator of RcsB-dependent stress response